MGSQIVGHDQGTKHSTARIYTHTHIYTFIHMCVCVYVYSFPAGSVAKNLPAMQETQEIGVQSLGQEDRLEEAMATINRM